MADILAWVQVEVRCEKLRVKLAGLLSLLFPLFPPPPHASVFMKNPLCGSLGREKVSGLSPFKACKLRDWRKNSVCLEDHVLSQAVTIKIPWTGFFTTEMCFSQPWRLAVWGWRANKGCMRATPSLQTSPSVLTRQKGLRGLAGASFIRTLISWRLCPHHLITPTKASPPDPITSGIRISTLEFWGDSCRPSTNLFWNVLQGVPQPPVSSNTRGTLGPQSSRPRRCRDWAREGAWQLYWERPVQTILTSRKIWKSTEALTGHFVPDCKKKKNCFRMLCCCHLSFPII